MTATPPQQPGRLLRSLPFEVIRADDADGAGLTLEGYAAVFDSPTVIDSWEGHFEESIRPGAFAKTIAERTPVLQFDHGGHPLLGSLPLGVITKLREDSRGLFVRARLSDNWLIAPIRDAIRDGAVNGMSFRFSVPKDKEDWDNSRTPPRRSLREVALYELGPVVFPAYDATTVGVRSGGSNELVAAVERRIAEEFSTPGRGAAPAGTPPSEAAPPDEPPEAHSPTDEPADRHSPDPDSAELPDDYQPTRRPPLPIARIRARVAESARIVAAMRPGE